MKEIPINAQFTGVVPRREARALWMAPVIGLSAKSQEYFPAMLAG